VVGVIYKKAVYLVMLLSILSEPCSASYIRITVSATSVTVDEEDDIALNLTIMNSGDEAANDMQVSLVLPKGFTAKPVLAGIMHPNIPYYGSFKIGVADYVKPGTYPVVIKTNYADANAHPFSTVSPTLIKYRQWTQRGVQGKMGELGIPGDAEGKLMLELSNLEDTPHTVFVRFHLPDELVADYYQTSVDLNPQGTHKVLVPIKSFGAIPDSSYSVFATMEYDEGGLHYSSLASGAVHILSKKPEDGGVPSWTPTVVLTLLIVVLIYMQFRSAGKGKASEGGFTLRIRGLRVAVNTEYIVNVMVFAAIYAFLLTVFTPDVMLSKTITTGGDMASHYYPARFMRDELLPRGHVIGWLPGWYGGMPLFQFYFPLPFVVIALLSYVIPLQIAFKLVTVFGVFTTPIACFYCMKLMKFRFPTPIFAAVFTLPFLFQESHSMWGGNIPSTLAGEFSYGISLSITILFYGTLYRGLTDKKHILHNAVILAIVAFTHVYTVLWVVASSVYLIYDKKKRKVLERILYLVKSYPLAFMLTGFWIIPLISRLPYTTSYDIPWNITEEILPAILWPFLALAGFGIFMCVYNREYRVGFFCYAIITALIFFVLSPSLHVVDIRFLPFVYLSLMILAAYGLSQLIVPFKGKWIIPLIFFILTIFWVNSNKVIVTEVDNVREDDGELYVHFNWTDDLDSEGLHINLHLIPHEMGRWRYTGFTPHWVRWNYEGFEGKNVWPQYKEVNDYMAGGEGNPRVKFEHNDKHNAAGSVRAFESIPLFAGRNILEGLYMQSIITSPFSFYIQGEVSAQQSCPFWLLYPCRRFDLDNGTKHLKMFNTQYLVARSDKVKKALAKHGEWEMAYRADPFEVWELTTNPAGYVTVPDNKPVLYETDDWRNISYQWFQRTDLIDTPIVFKGKADKKDEALFTDIVRNPKVDDLDGLPETPLNRVCNINELVREEEIEFTTDCVGLPHIISISYYPSWKPVGADRVYLVSPSFMLVYPTQRRVKLVYSKTPVDLFGLLLSAVAVVIVSYAFLTKNRGVRDFFRL
jgi:hypothetical protein